jgi:glycosyltransferase involved in cell wall biosynthesis
MKITRIICTRNRAEQLSMTLSKFNTALMNAHQIELEVVDSESTDGTPKVMADFAEKYREIRIVRAGKGLGRARNARVEAARGDLIAFTDDDCYLDDNYYTALRVQFAAPREHHYGMGQILLFDEEDDWRIANATISQLVTIKPTTVLPTGTREFRGAADYIRFRLGAGDTLGKEVPRTSNAGQPSAEMPSPKRAQGAKA